MGKKNSVLLEDKKRKKCDVYTNNTWLRVLFEEW